MSNGMLQQIHGGKETSTMAKIFRDMKGYAKYDKSFIAHQIMTNFAQVNLKTTNI